MNEKQICNMAQLTHLSLYKCPLNQVTRAKVIVQYCKNAHSFLFGNCCLLDLVSVYKKKFMQQYRFGLFCWSFYTDTIVSFIWRRWRTIIQPLFYSMWALYTCIAWGIFLCLFTLIPFNFFCVNTVYELNVFYISSRIKDKKIYLAEKRSRAYFL